MVPPKLVGMNVALVINRAYPDTGVIAAVHPQQIEDFAGTQGVLFLCFEVKIDSVSVITDGEYFIVHTTPVHIDGAFTNRIDHRPGLRVVDIRVLEIAAATGVSQVVEANSADSFILDQLENGGDFLIVEAGYRQPQRTLSPLETQFLMPAKAD